MMFMKKIFKEADADNRGSITRDELQVCFRRLEFSFSPVVLQLFEELFDTDKSGTIDYQGMLLRVCAYSLLILKTTARH